MTEYTTSSEAVREYMTARERTALWVQTYTQDGADPSFVSPSSPPSAISDSDAPSYGPDSDDESSHSVPPRMVLRYGDGRPDIPISTHAVPPSGSRSGLRPRVSAPMAPPQAPAPSHIRSKSGSNIPDAPPNMASRHLQSLSYVTEYPPAVPGTLKPATPPRSPESIVVLPSRQGDEPPHSAVSTPRNPSHQSHHSHSGSRSHSRSPSSQVALDQANYSPQRSRGDVPSYQPSHSSIVAPAPKRAFDPAQIPLPNSSPSIAYSQSQPLPQRGHEFDARAASARVQSQLPYAYSPPAIVYAPSSKHSKSRYTPPAIVYSPSNSHHPHSHHAAPSLTYSHSAPLPPPSHRSHAGSAAYQSAHGSATHYPPGPIPEEPTNPRPRSHGRSRSGSVARSRTPGQNVVYVDHPRNAPTRASSPAESFDGSDRGSRTSGSTYYVLPTPGQKVKLIVPNSASIYTATSTTKSAHSPQSAHSGPKKPFFQRIFHLPRLPGSGSSTDSRGHAGPGRSGNAHLWRIPWWRALYGRHRA